ncbi:hypothetical protein QZH41_001699, partial [Actinostola sp. cb2023]
RIHTLASQVAQEAQSRHNRRQHHRRSHNRGILAAADGPKEHLGKYLSLGDVEKQGNGRLHTRYEAVVARCMLSTTVTGVLSVACKLVAFVLPFTGVRLYVEKALLASLQKDELITSELSNATAAYVVNSRMGHYIAFASSALHVIGHVEFGSKMAADAGSNDGKIMDTMY